MYFIKPKKKNDGRNCSRKDAFNKDTFEANISFTTKKDENFCKKYLRVAWIFSSKTPKREFATLKDG